MNYSSPAVLPSWPVIRVIDCRLKISIFLFLSSSSRCVISRRDELCFDQKKSFYPMIIRFNWIDTGSEGYFNSMCERKNMVHISSVGLSICVYEHKYPQNIELSALNRWTTAWEFIGGDLLRQCCVCGPDSNGSVDDRRVLDKSNKLKRI